MLVLAIETATDHASVVVWEKNTEQAAWRETTHQDLLQRLAGEVTRVMKAAGHEFSQLDLVSVGLGPGSFTSLRVGLATAKGICAAYDLPLVGISSLAAMTWQARHRFSGLACPILDARRGEVYGGLFRLQGETVARVREEFVATPSALAERVTEAAEPVTIFGQMDRVPVQEIVEATAGRVQIWREDVMVPEAGAIAYLGEQRFATAGGDDLTSLHPLYVRKSYAEEKFDIDLGLR